MIDIQIKHSPKLSIISSISNAEENKTLEVRFVWSFFQGAGCEGGLSVSETKTLIVAVKRS